jgi:REP element-mobilizing transposase RayT
MVMSQWNAQTNRFPVVRLDAFVAMPNHIHAILWIESDVGAGIWATVGAGLVPARMPTDDLVDSVGAGLVPAHMPADDPVDSVGAGLVPAHMPNRATTRVAPTPTHTSPARVPTIGDIVGAFKSSTTVAYARGVEQSGWPAFHGKLWQRNSYEHVIRDDDALTRIRQYIIDNPAQWAMDRENPQNEAVTNRATTRVAPTELQADALADVGATLVIAHDAVDSIEAKGVGYGG